MRFKFMIAIVMTVVSVVLFESRCQGEKEFVVKYFPVEVGNWWEHEYRFLVVEYDTVTNDTFENLFVESRHDEITGTNTVAGWSCYRFHETLHHTTQWFAHPDSALLCIAALTDNIPGFVEGSSRDIIYLLHGAIFRTASALASYMKNMTSGLSRNLDADTVYLIPPHKYFVYPMSIGTSWVMMTEPWYEEREVVAAESVTVGAGTFYTLKLRVVTDLGSEDERYIWIGEEGMIKDSIYSRGVATNVVGDTIGYFDVYTMYELLSLNLE
ncbi:MAG: hypothetical protein OEV79_06665 [candidate division WOR-3 bacterium]|nr:hypothetical protein [candidate division WOR-3 bacterium]